MTKKQTLSADQLPSLLHNRWAVPTLAALYRMGGGAKLVTLYKTLGASRGSIQRTLAGLTESGLVKHNPGYGHPMRPEYMLTATGNEIAPVCVQLIRKLERLGIEEIGLRKWSLPVAHALAAAGGRFNRLRAVLGGVTPRALSAALRDLQLAGLVERFLVDDTPPRTEYQLTGAGRRLTSVVSSLAQAAPTARH